MSGPTPGHCPACSIDLTAEEAHKDDCPMGEAERITLEGLEKALRSPDGGPPAVYEVEAVSDTYARVVSAATLDVITEHSGRYALRAAQDHAAAFTYGVDPATTVNQPYVAPGYELVRVIDSTPRPCFADGCRSAVIRILVRYGIDSPLAFYAHGDGTPGHAGVVFPVDQCPKCRLFGALVVSKDIERCLACDFVTAAFITDALG